jgi:hypothetical protein
MIGSLTLFNHPIATGVDEFPELLRTPPLFLALKKGVSPSAFFLPLPDNRCLHLGMVLTVRLPLLQLLDSTLLIEEHLSPSFEVVQGDL